MADIEPGKLLEDLWDPSARQKVWERLTSASPTISEAILASSDHARAILNFSDWEIWRYGTEFQFRYRCRLLLRRRRNSQSPIYFPRILYPSGREYHSDFLCRRRSVVSHRCATSA